MDNTIFIYRGNHKTVTVSIPGTTLSTGDTIKLAVKDSWQGDKTYIEKTITNFENGKAVITFNKDDTKDMAPGEYYYDVLWTDSSSRPQTVIGPSAFVVKAVITI